MNRYTWLDEYLQSKPGAQKDYKTEWGWFRYRVCDRMFAAVCTPEADHPQHRGRTMAILKCDPLLAELLRTQYEDIVPGFYMNKRNWNSVYLDGAVPEDVLKLLCDEAFDRTYAALTKKERAGIENAPKDAGQR